MIERVIAEVPGPRLGDSQGWAAIDRVGAWDAHLSRFSTMEECPSQYKASWAWAWGQILENEAAAESELDKERALKWICFLPQALLRSPNRGGKSGRGAVNKRFSALARGDWEAIVSIWESDVRSAKKKDERRRGARQTRRETQQNDKENLKRAVIALVSQCQFPKQSLDSALMVWPPWLILTSKSKWLPSILLEVSSCQPEW